MTARRDAGGAVDVNPDVAFVAEVGRAGVQTHAHADRTRGQSSQRVGGRLECAGCGREGDEEGVPLGIHLDAVVAGAGLADHAPVLGERRGVCLRSQLVQQLGRALDVGEQEGDRAGGEIASHEEMMPSQGKASGHAAGLRLERRPPQRRKRG